MTRLNKGTIFEEYVCNYINENNNNITAYLWKNVPDFILFNAKLIDDIDDCRINRETCKNYIHDIGIDIIQINNDTNKIGFIQCKNYEGSLCINDLSGYFAIMAQSEHYDKEGIIYTSNNKYSYNLMKVCKNNTHTFIHLSMENNISISKNMSVLYSYQLECINKLNEYNSQKNFLEFPLFENKITTKSIAVYFKKLYGDKFIHQNENIYFFNGVYWKPESIKALPTLNKYVFNNFYDRLLEDYKSYESKKLNDFKGSCDLKELLVKNLIIIKNKINDLENSNKRSAYIVDIITVISDNEIQFDKKPYLYAFNNKIYDLSICKFIEPTPDQYISITCGYNFIKQDETENKKYLHKLFNTIFPEEDLKKLYLTILASGMDGIASEKFICANGKGGNGKGVINEFFQEVIGNYFYILPSDVLLKPLQGGNNPSIANMKNKRFCLCREPDQNLTLNCATIKELTGGNEIHARLNYSNDTKITINLTLVLECNKKPNLSESTDAMARRLIDIPFKNQFVSQQIYEKLDDEDKITTFLTNSYYKSIAFKEKYKYAFFEILCEYYKMYNENTDENNERKFPLIEEVMLRNNAYLEDSDHMFSWFNDQYTKTDDKKDIIKVKQIYENYKDSSYFQNLNRQQKRLDNYKNFCVKIEENMFLKKYFKQDGNKVYIMTNYVIKIDDEEVNPNDYLIEN